MNQTAQIVRGYFQKKNLKFEELTDDMLAITYTGENLHSIRMILSFDADGKSVSVGSYSIAKLKDDSPMEEAKGCILCNTLNEKWRWIKFTLDDENEIATHCDAVLDFLTAGEECQELVERMSDIVDKSYPLIMKTIWG